MIKNEHDWLRNQIIASPPCAVQVVWESGEVLNGLEGARNVLKALVKAGYVIAPREPTNSMFDAYMTALRCVPVNHRTVIENIGKARRRWKAMAEAGTKITFSKRNIKDD